MSRIATIINFCTNDFPFLAPCLREARLFSDQIIVPVCDHFFDGVPENRELLEVAYAEHPDVTFLEFPYDQESLYGSHGPYFWHDLARLIGFSAASADIEYLLFLDTDEIVEGEKFADWLCSGKHHPYGAVTLSCFWYFREPKWEAEHWEDTPLLIRRSEVSAEALMQVHERLGTFLQVSSAKTRAALGPHGLPMVHHYSWVRTQEQMLRKVSSWSHRNDRNWEKLVQEEFSRPFNGRDFVHGYQFKEVDPYIHLDVRAMPATFPRGEKSNVRRLKTGEVHQIDLALHFGI